MEYLWSPEDRLPRQNEEQRLGAIEVAFFTHREHTCKSLTIDATNLFTLAKTRFNLS